MKDLRYLVRGVLANFIVQGDRGSYNSSGLKKAQGRRAMRRPILRSQCIAGVQPMLKAASVRRNHSVNMQAKESVFDEAAVDSTAPLDDGTDASLNDSFAAHRPTVLPLNSVSPETLINSAGPTDSPKTDSQAPCSTSAEALSAAPIAPHASHAGRMQFRKLGIRHAAFHGGDATRLAIGGLERIDHGAVVGTVAGGLDDHVLVEAQVVAQCE